MELKDVENLAELARLELSLEEKEALLKDMDGILAYVKQIEGVEIKDTNVQHSVFNTTNYNVWREDKIEPREFSQKLIVEQFPDAQDGFLKVKKIL